MSGKYTRRSVIKTGAGAAVGGILLGTDPAEARKRRRHHHHRKKKPKKPRARRADVIVIGAGISGLTAARKVAAAGRSVIVLEARDRVGGRILNHDIGGGKITELGAQFVGPTQDHILQLMGEVGVEKFNTYDTGLNIYYDGSSAQTFSDQLPTGAAPVQVAPEAAAVVGQLDSMSQQVPVDAPWNSPSAQDWDGQTLETFIKNNSASSQFRAVSQTATEAIFGAEMRDISLLYTLFYIAASGNEQNQGTFERNFNTRDGAQQWRCIGGTQQVPIRVAAALGRSVVLNTPARRIVQSGSSVRVDSDTQSFTGKRVIVAVPPAMALRIQYEPLLPPLRDQLTQHMAAGSLMKAEAIYDKPFWRDAGLTGQAVSTSGYVRATFDNTPPDGSPGILMGFIGGTQARVLQQQPFEKRRAAALQDFANYFGSQALSPRDFVVFNWCEEEWNRGCPVSILSPGVLTDFGTALRTPVGLIHWAGTETSTYWNGYMDGGVRAGKRAAAEVLAEI